MASQPIEIEAPVIAEQGANDDAPAPRDFEAEAKKQGWRPREDFPGDDGRFVDAETFVRRGEELQPFLKKENKVLEAKVERLEKKLAKQEQIEARAYDRAVADLKAKQEAAVELGDVEAFRAIGKEIDGLEATRPTVEAPTDDAVQKAVKAFAEANPWYSQPGEARDYADFIAQNKYAPLAQTMPPDEFFAFIAEKTLATFPDLAGEKPRAKPRSMVEAPTNRGMTRGQKTFADLPVEAQRMADKFIKSGVVKDRAAYLKDYQW